MTTKKEPWEQWFERHRGDELAAVVLQLIRVLAKRGKCTAEDCHNIEVRNPNIRGAAMKALRRFGVAEKSALAYGKTEQSHGHTMFVWTLVDGGRAEQILSRFANVVRQQPAGTARQMVLI